MSAVPKMSHFSFNCSTTNEIIFWDLRSIHLLRCCWVNHIPLWLCWFSGFTHMHWAIPNKDLMSYSNHPTKLNEFCKCSNMTRDTQTFLQSMRIIKKSHTMSCNTCAKCKDRHSFFFFFFFFVLAAVIVRSIDSQTHRGKIKTTAE